MNTANNLLYLTRKTLECIMNYSDFYALPKYMEYCPDEQLNDDSEMYMVISDETNTWYENAHTGLTLTSIQFTEKFKNGKLKKKDYSKLWEENRKINRKQKNVDQYVTPPHSPKNLLKVLVVEKHTNMILGEIDKDGIDFISGLNYDNEKK